VQSIAEDLVREHAYLVPEEKVAVVTQLLFYLQTRKARRSSTDGLVDKDNYARSSADIELSSSVPADNASISNSKDSLHPF
jgi:hypothetical protein